MDITFLSETLSDVHLNAPSFGVLFAFFMAIVLLFVSGFASASEIAFFSLSPSDVSELEQSKTKKDKHISMLREDNERTLATILIGNNFVNVTIIMLCNYAFGNLISFGAKAYWLQFLSLTVILTFLLLLFGEIIPKVYSRQNPLAYCRVSVGGIMFMRRLFWPLETILIKSEKSILQGIIRFGDETAKEIMTSRQDIVDIDIRSSFSEVMSCILENNYSRIPVYQDNDDNIRGILYIKDLLPHVSKPANFRWQSLIRSGYFVPETKKIDDLLREFQENKIHIAIVVDEFGGTCGLVTLEDILEEIVGEINDEYDDDEKTYSKINYNTYLFEGKTLLSDLSRILNVDDDAFSDVEGDADTLAGMLLEIKGDFLSLHERIDYKNYTFEVMELEGRRISRVKVIVHDLHNN